MDNHIGDWLYYIVILAVAIISMLNGLNKKKQQQAPVPSDEMSPPVPMRQQKQTPPPPVPKHSLPHSFLSARAADEGERAFTPEPFVFTEEKDSEWMDKLDLTDTDAFRKALIYSEILKRKY